MIWNIFLICIGLTSARNVKNVEPEYLEALRASGQDEEFAKLMGVDVSFVRPDNEERSEGSKFNHVSPLGDIMLIDEQERQGLNFQQFSGYKWPNAQIPYTISSSDFTSNQLQFIESAIQDFNARSPVVKLVKRRRQKDYVMVISGNGCWSYLGRVGGQQSLSLQRNGCLSTGTVQHEFMHAAGFTHEHNRSDRDSFVQILWGNIPENWHSQYQKVNDEDYVNIGDYDYDSVMHYPIWAPETYEDAFYILEDGVDKNRLGQDDGLSKIDAEKLSKLYS